MCVRSRSVCISGVCGVCWQWVSINAVYGAVCVCVFCNDAHSGKLRGTGSPADYCQTALVKGSSQVIKEQQNKRGVSIPPE